MHTGSIHGAVRPRAATATPDDPADPADPAGPRPGVAAGPPRGAAVVASPPPPPDSADELSPHQLFDHACRHLLGRGQAFSGTVVDRIRAEVPYYADPVLAPPDLPLSVHKGVRITLEAALDPGRIVNVERYTRELGIRRAEESRPLDEVLHAFRVAGSEVWSGIVGAAERDGFGERRHLVRVAELVWKINDRDCVLLADAYRQVAKGAASRHDERVRLILAAVLESRDDPAFIRDAASILDLPPDGRFAVAEIRATPPFGRAPDAVPEVRGMRILRHTGGRREVLVAHLGDRPLDALVSALDPGPGPGTRIGVSPVVQGLENLPRARDMAGLALRTCRGDGEIARLDARLPDGLLVARPDLSAELALRVLRPVCELEPADRETLMDTLGVWIEKGGSAVQAARHMLCHRNTVLNRLRRFEQLTGLELSRPRDLVQLTLAFDALQLLGPAAVLGCADTWDRDVDG
ncbi:PucR family transcriptional regulator [Streptomyces sp. NPDC007808]|uniref:PucR family transcriptional regulator n=1 Tax=Streptomyces sp. NPDC007808 TaxID=3364779 RepID=UPI0036AE90CD